MKYQRLMKDASKANYVNCINITGNFATVEHHEAKWPTLLDVEPVIFQHSVCDPVLAMSERACFIYDTDYCRLWRKRRS